MSFAGLDMVNQRGISVSWGGGSPRGSLGFSHLIGIGAGGVLVVIGEWVNVVRAVAYVVEHGLDR